MTSSDAGVGRVDDRNVLLRAGDGRRVGGGSLPRQLLAEEGRATEGR